MANAGNAAIVDDILGSYRESPVDILGVGDAEGEASYLQTLRESYVRTLDNLSEIARQGRETTRVLEIGSFLGALSFAMKAQGKDVTALDIPEFAGSPALQARYAAGGVPFHGQNLRTGPLPFLDRSFDLVIMCEVLEHLSFNPLPVLAEINRVLKEGGVLYIGMPNQAGLRNRVKAMLGKSIHNPIEDFFKQLSKDDNMIVGLHWREYTLPETVEMVTRMGFAPLRTYHYANTPRGALWRRLAERVAYRVPSLRPFQVVVAQKIASPTHDFRKTEATS